MTDPERPLAADVPVRPAATVLIVRDSDVGPEVFMLQRTMSASFAKGQYVFPGGRVDDADHGDAFEPICAGLDDGAASRRLGLEHGGLAWMVAAIRECFEEAGVLLARPADGNEIMRFDTPAVIDRFNDLRHRVHDGSVSLADLCAAERLLLLTDEMHLMAHWVTPLGERKRFDTRFFVTRAPDAQEPLHDDLETIDSLWVRPGDALTMWQAGELQMFPPTVETLRFVEPHLTAAGAVEAAEHVGVPPKIVPRLRIDEGRLRGVVVPGDADFESTPLPEHVIGR